jgi:hypothetical protein
MVMNHRYFYAVIEDGENMTVVITKTLEFVAVAGMRQVRVNYSDSKLIVVKKLCDKSHCQPFCF